MKNLFKIALLAMVITYSPSSLWAMSQSDNGEKNYFQFVVPRYHTTRQAGQTVNIYVRYAYKKELAITEYPDYRALRAEVLKYMEPTSELPAEVFWEILAQHMGKDLMNHFPLQGVSVQLEVLDNQSPDAYEPGDHGPTFTLGDIAPLDIHH